MGLVAAATTSTAFAQFQPAPLAPGPGQGLVESTCSACHMSSYIPWSSGYTKEGWRALTRTMVDLSGSPEIEDKILTYLATRFPPNNKRAPKLVPGPLKLTFTEWVVPTLGQRARDPVEARDGKIWWVGQSGNVIGWINPATGEMKEYDLPPGALPHSVNIDSSGTPWYTGNGNGTIGKLDPVTGKVTEYRMPDPAAKDPHTAEFDRNGIYWFTLQQSNMIGRLDPKTGAIKLKSLPWPGSRPYGIKIDAQGAPWVACAGRNCLIRVDPAGMDLKEIALPHAETRVRRLDIDQDGVIVWYGDDGRGFLGRYDPKTGQSKEWPSPSGPDSHPYGLAFLSGAVWYNESGKRPDALVRFDPKIETFQSWAIPSGSIYAGIVRHMRATRNGDLLIHQDSTNRIIRVRIEPSR
jgi:virginiamycin B lyase